MLNNTFQTTHPKNGFDVNVTFDEDFRVVGATYDDGEDIEMNNVIKSHLQADVNHFVKGEM